MCAQKIENRNSQNRYDWLFWNQIKCFKNKNCVGGRVADGLNIKKKVVGVLTAQTFSGSDKLNRFTRI